MADFMQHPWFQLVAWALIHFVWQGAAIALAALLAFQFARTPGVRYAIGVIALATMALAPVGTLAVLANQSQPVALPALSSAQSAQSAAPLSAPSSEPASEHSSEPPARVLGVIVTGWLAGVLFFVIRLAGGWVVARRMARRFVEPATEEIQRLAQNLGVRLGVRRAVSILQSHAISVPVVVGWIAPTIVLPIAALSGLSSAQVEALLAHELAHVRRHDYLVNLLQSVVEVALFYHPAVWWLSRQVRAERERCCDDLAVAVCDRVVYASALGDLAALASPKVALAATDGDLLGRVRRILSREEVVMSGRSRWSGVAVLGLALSMMVPVSMLSAGPDVTGQSPISQSLDDMLAERNIEAQTQSEQAAAAQMEAMRRLHDELRAKLAELERLLGQNLDKAKHEIAKHERTQAQHAKLADHVKLAVADLQKHAMVDQAKMHALTAEMEKKVLAAQIDHIRLREALQAKVAQQTTDQHRAQELLQAKVADLMHASQASQLNHAMLTQSTAQTAQQQANARELYERLLQRRAGLESELLETVTDEKATIGASDVLRITIGGEPDLPPAYRVTTEGTIRLPFVGPVKVVGLTVAQARDAIGKQLADRRLGSASQVTVAITRAKK